MSDPELTASSMPVVPTPTEAGFAKSVIANLILQP
jgi:hypothetical protein